MTARSLALAALFAGCGVDAPGPAETTTSQLDQIQHGRDIWLTSTFGGEKFFSVILPGPPFNLTLGLDLALTSPRDSRFASFGLINDPDCAPGDASTGFLDRCPDPTASGVVGIRKTVVVGPDGPHVLVGVACAGCHAGLDPANPPDDPNHPAWANIHPTVGNQYLQSGKLFAAHLSTHDPRWQVFASWAPGTVDTTAIESDGINNPGIITQFWDFPDRPYFDLTHDGSPIHVHRAGQGGEDDAGCEAAALRVYFNIGMCAAECMVPHLANGPGGTQTPIDDAECSARCPDYLDAKAAVADECAFIASTQPPRLADAPHGSRFVDHTLVEHGRRVFDATCAGCHSNGRPRPHDVLSDDLIHPMADIGTNSCRARTTNWEAGHIWAEFSSDQYKARPTGGAGFYRDVPLLGIWATAPFFHNNALGRFTGDPSVAGRIAAYEDAMDQLLNPWNRDLLGSIKVTTDTIVVAGLTLPAGTPVALFANLNPATGENLCPDLVENQGHYYGWYLPPSDKRALTEFLKTQ
jgi:mono/diheme cytochrome c family protein